MAVIMVETAGKASFPYRGMQTRLIQWKINHYLCLPITVMTENMKQLQNTWQPLLI